MRLFRESVVNGFRFNTRLFVFIFFYGLFSFCVDNSIIFVYVFPLKMLNWFCVLLTV